MAIDDAFSLRLIPVVLIPSASALAAGSIPNISSAPLHKAKSPNILLWKSLFFGWALP